MDSLRACLPVRPAWIPRPRCVPSHPASARAVLRCDRRGGRRAPSSPPSRGGLGIKSKQRGGTGRGEDSVVAWTRVGISTFRQGSPHAAAPAPSPQRLSCLWVGPSTRPTPSPSTPSTPRRSTATSCSCGCQTSASLPVAFQWRSGIPPGMPLQRSAETLRRLPSNKSSTSHEISGCAMNAAL